MTVFIAVVVGIELVHLKGLTGREYLRVDGTQVTAVGVQDLQKALPDCEIER